MAQHTERPRVHGKGIGRDLSVPMAWGPSHIWEAEGLGRRAGALGWGSRASGSGLVLRTPAPVLLPLQCRGGAPGTATHAGWATASGSIHPRVTYWASRPGGRRRRRESPAFSSCKLSVWCRE